MTSDPPGREVSQPQFRHSAVEAAAGSQIGEPLQTHWRGMTIFTSFAFAVVIALFTFAALTEYSPIHRVPAYVDVPGGLVRLGAPISGHVSELTVQQGATVSRGTLLATIDSDRLRADGGSQHGVLKRKFDDERTALQREVVAARQEALANQSLIDRKLAGLRAERDALQTELAAGEKLLASLRGQSEQIAAVAARGYATKIQTAQKQDEVAMQESRIASTHSALARVELDIATADAERRVVEAKLSGLIENRLRSSGELTRLEAQSDSDAEQVVRAPIDGIVSTAMIAKGQSVVADQPMFTIAPVDQPNVMRVLVPARAAASVKAGLDIKVVFRAYPQEKFGEFLARIESVSDTPSLPAEIERVYAVTEPTFIATASLPKALISPGGQELKIRPGMLADALVPIERRSVLEWLFEPILRGFNESAGQSHPASASNPKAP